MNASDLFKLRTVSEDAVIEHALNILENRARYGERPVLDAPDTVRNFLRLRIGAEDREEFWCVFLDAQNRLIEMESMFVGTLTQTSIYPREVVKRALQLNAAGVILAHNHPSGSIEPSSADQALTLRLRDALSLIDVRVLDHLIVTAHTKPLSFAERGLI